MGRPNGRFSIVRRNNMQSFFIGPVVGRLLMLLGSTTSADAGSGASYVYVWADLVLVVWVIAFFLLIYAWLFDKVPARRYKFLKAAIVGSISIGALVLPMFFWSNWLLVLISMTVAFFTMIWVFWYLVFYTPKPIRHLFRT